MISAVAVALLVAGGIFAGLAASDNLPWKTHVQVARDGTATQATPVPTATPQPGASPSPSTAPVTKVTFATPFPNLPTLDRPTNMVQLGPGGWFLLTQQDGRIVTFPDDPSVSSATTVLDLTGQVSRSGNEEGLLGLAIDPGFGSGHYMFLYYSAKPGDRRTVISRFTLTGSGAGLRADPASELLILTIPQPFGNHKGGQLAFGPDGMLYAGIGDGGSEGDPNGNGQDIKKNLLGSIIRIDVRNATKDHPYAIPPDNPLATSPNGERPETWAYGLRNPWRFTFDQQGTLVAGEVGQDTYEELDVIERGGNYGWNIMEATHCYKPSSGCNMNGLKLPFWEYRHDGGACSVTGGYVAFDQRIPGLYYVFGDYCTGAVWNIGIPGEGGTPEAIQLRAKGNSISSFAQDASGRIYVLDFNGKIERIDP